MSEDTEEQEAYAALESAIKRVNQLNRWGKGPDGEPMLIVDYVVMIAAQGWDSGGQGFGAIGWILKDGDMPWYRIVGLVRAGQMRIEHQLVTMDGEE